MSWCRLAACASLVLVAGCAWEGPALAQAHAPMDSQPAAQLQRPGNEPIPDSPAATTNKPQPPPGQAAVRILATVNEVAILDDEVHQAIRPFLPQLQSMPEPQRGTELQKAVRAVLDKLIERELLIADVTLRLKKNPRAEKKLKEAAAKEFEKNLQNYREQLSKQGVKIESDDDLKPFLATQGLTLEFLKRRAERDFMAHEYLMNRIWPQVEKLGHKEIRQYYEEHPGEFQHEDGVKWLHIFISNRNPEHPDPASARRLAEEIAGRLKAGEDFAQLAERYDEGLSKFAHGEGRGQLHGEIRPFELEAYLFRMREGDIGPIIEMPSGCHLIKLVSREYAGLMPFDEATQLTVKRKLQGIVMQRESRRFVDELRRKATIKYFDNP